jgi:hypothetical protein
MNEEQLEFPMVPGKRAKKAKPNDLDFQAPPPGASFLSAVRLRCGSRDCE